MLPVALKLLKGANWTVKAPQQMLWKSGFVAFLPIFCNKRHESGK
jgi:hypothetical protein